MRSNYCPSCLKESSQSFCNACRRKLFSGGRVHHYLTFTREDFVKRRERNISKVFLPGDQEKYFLKLEFNRISLCDEGGEYIIKTGRRDNIFNAESLPANEHLTMQIASSVFNINTALNAIVFFPGSEAAYITKRFDIAEGKTKAIEVLKFSESERKENSSYEEIAQAMKNIVSAYKVEAEKFFKITVFNYIFSNRDKGIKFPGLYKNDIYNDYLLAPVYGLKNMRLHVSEENLSTFNLCGEEKKGYTAKDFYEFGCRMGLRDIRIKRILNEMLNSEEMISELIGRSFLSEEMKEKYRISVTEKIRELKGEVSLTD